MEAIIICTLLKRLEALCPSPVLCGNVGLVRSSCTALCKHLWQGRAPKLVGMDGREEGLSSSSAAGQRGQSIAQKHALSELGLQDMEALGMAEASAVLREL